MFGAYPTAPAPNPRRHLRAADIGKRPDVAQTFALRRYAESRRMIEDPARLQAILAHFAGAGDAGASVDEVAGKMRLQRPVVARAALWLMKYHFLTEVP
jgi:hypothetical protein